MFGDNITISQAVTVCVFSLAIVFLVLWAITLLIDVTAWVLKKFTGARAQPASCQAAVPAAQPDQRDGTADAVLAAAAIAAYLGKSTDQFVVRSIRRIAGEQSPWSQAGRSGTAQ